MKFFTPKYINRDEPKTKEAEEIERRELGELRRTYELQFEKVKRLFSKQTLSYYEKNYGFHDFSIVEIQVKKSIKSNTKPYTEVQIILKGKDLYFLKYKSVSYLEFNHDISDEHAMVVDNWDSIDTYMYNEFDIVDLNNNVYSHEILTLTNNNIKIHFKRFIIEKQKS